MLHVKGEGEIEIGIQQAGRPESSEGGPIYFEATRFHVRFKDRRSGQTFELFGQQIATGERLLGISGGDAVPLQRIKRRVHFFSGGDCLCGYRGLQAQASETIEHVTCPRCLQIMLKTMLRGELGRRTVAAEAAPDFEAVRALMEEKAAPLVHRPNPNVHYLPTGSPTTLCGRSGIGLLAMSRADLAGCPDCKKALLRLDGVTTCRVNSSGVSEASAKPEPAKQSEGIAAGEALAEAVWPELMKMREQSQAHLKRKVGEQVGYAPMPSRPALEEIRERERARLAADEACRCGHARRHHSPGDFCKQLDCECTCFQPLVLRIAIDGDAQPPPPGLPAAYPQLAEDVPPAEQDPALKPETWHASLGPGKAWCGNESPNQAITSVLPKVTCAECLRLIAASAKPEPGPVSFALPDGADLIPVQDGALQLPPEPQKSETWRDRAIREPLL